MCPQPELIRLAARKATLRRDIAAHRAQCAEAAAVLARPLAWLDRARALVGRLSPLALGASVPLGFMVARAFLSRRRILGAFVRWVPLALVAVRRFSSSK
jgi:hypothetical protein